MICLASSVPTNKTLSEEEYIRLANEWNADKMFCIVYYYKDSFRCNYYWTFAGGLHADNLNETLNWYFQIMYGVSDYLEEREGAASR